MTITLTIEFEPHRTVCSAEGSSFTMPVGPHTLADMLEADPPSPESLTNAIGLLSDHLEDVTREVPASTLADEVIVCGTGMATVVAVEAGVPVALPVVLQRAAAEELFRALATEARRERLHNPALPAEEVHTVLGACCAAVAVLRRLDRQQLMVQEPAT